MEKNAASPMGTRPSAFPPGSVRTRAEAAEETAANFLAEYRILKDTLQTTEESNASLRMQVGDILRENEELRQKLNEAEARVIFLQGYSVEITTCLDILKNTNNTIIDKAINRARESGLKMVLAPRQETPEEVREGIEAAEIIRGLPEVSPIRERGA
jgi:chromosome segregation ATPase